MALSQDIAQQLADAYGSGDIGAVNSLLGSGISAEDVRSFWNFDDAGMAALTNAGVQFASPPAAETDYFAQQFAPDIYTGGLSAITGNNNSVLEDTSNNSYVNYDSNANTGGLTQAASVNTPNYDQIIQNAYGTIGRSGVGEDTSQIDQGGYNHFLNMLQTGAVKPEDFGTVFSGAVDRYITDNPNDRYTQYVNNYRGVTGANTDTTTAADTTAADTTVADTTVADTAGGLDTLSTNNNNQLSGIILGGDSWLAGDDFTKIANTEFGQNVTNTAVGGQTTSDVLNQLNHYDQFLKSLLNLLVFSMDYIEVFRYLNKTKNKLLERKYYDLSISIC
jgi:hypothetical protein